MKNNAINTILANSITNNNITLDSPIGPWRLILITLKNPELEITSLIGGHL